MKNVLKFTLMGCGGVSLIFVFLIVLAVVVFDGDTPAEEESIISASSDVNEEEIIEEEVRGEEEVLVNEEVVIGEPLDVNDVVFTVNDLSTASNFGGEWGQDAKGEFIVVNVSVTNNRNEAITVDSSFFKLLINDVEYKADGSAAIWANEDAEFLLESVNPGLTLSGYIPFDVAPELDLTNGRIQVQTGFFGTETGEISLK
ncbi:hypothetical protein JMA_29270 [Jeotgalibacillus malaysiensis]|uniref:DUF4352 domain-containing protein n=1 Tax=Jeotgalibacillus malaysiensis TaxID=1508404 RepID=A0A0B5AW42_9BACL|nr:DUF4352 domain-containing protein [Jeotgalibacillus malaysiensis]AJD92244.1 hypothetical protein JMA_29270 [Jeotgalibacillus malaysiensis]